MMRSALVSLVCLAAAGTASAQATGTVTHNGKTMTVKATVGVWDAKRSTLKLWLLPYTPTAEEIAQIQKGQTMWMLQKKSVDPKTWPGASPHAWVALNWNYSQEAVGTLAKAWGEVYAFGIGADNSNLNFSHLAGEIKGTLSGGVKPGSTVTFAGGGEESMEKEKLSWKVNVTTKVLPGLF